jgi:uncharacterized membrane protein YidH (DUF202 family)
MMSRMEFPTSDTNGVKCSPISSVHLRRHWCEAKHVHLLFFPALGAALLLNVMIFSILCGFLGLARFQRVARTLHSTCTLPTGQSTEYIISFSLIPNRTTLALMVLVDQ